MRQGELSTQSLAAQQARDRENLLQTKYAKEVEMHRKTAEDLQQQLDRAQENMIEQLNKIQAAASKNYSDYQAEQEKVMEAQKSHHDKQIKQLNEGLKNAQEAATQHQQQQAELQNSQYEQALALHKKHLRTH